MGRGADGVDAGLPEHSIASVEWMARLLVVWSGQ